LQKSKMPLTTRDDGWLGDYRSGEMPSLAVGLDIHHSAQQYSAQEGENKLPPEHCVFWRGGSGRDSQLGKPIKPAGAKK